MINTRRCVALGVLVALCACRSSTAPEPVPPGEAVALLSGAFDDSFVAVGAEPPPHSPVVTFASARPGAAAGVFGIMALRAGSGVHDTLILELYGATGPGSYPARGAFLHGVQSSSFSGGRRFEFVDGEVRITSLADGRIVGEFETMAVSVHLRFPPAASSDTLWLQNGRFDVPIVRFPR